MSRRKRMLETLDQDIRDHIERETQDNIERGMSPEEARFAALRKFGNVTRVKEETREVWSFVWLEQLWQDTRYGLRMLRRSPGFTAVTILTLALGIGANTAIFSVVNAVLLRRLPFPQSVQLVSVQLYDTILKAPNEYLSIPNFFDWRRQNQVFSGMAAFTDYTCTLTGAGRPVHLNAEWVSADFFSTLGVALQLGRGFLSEEEKKGSNFAILSDRLWRTMFSADKNIIGRSITLDNKSHIVVGVAPPGFDFPIMTPPVEIWTTIGEVVWYDVRAAHGFFVLGRMKPGVTIAQAQTEMSRIDALLAKEYPNSNLRYGGAVVVPELQHLVGDASSALWILFGAVGFVLLIACANVASLLLARSMTRQREMAVRTALGAGRLRTISQLLTESVLLALISGFVGFVLALWGTAGLLRLVPQNVPRISQIQMDGRVFLFTLLAAILTGILFGLAPALQSSKRSPFDTLRTSGAGAGVSGAVPQNRLRSALVVVEIALALTLLMGAGLMLQSFASLQRVNPGFNPHNALTFTFDLPKNSYSEDQKTIFYGQLLDRLNSLPEVVSAAAAVTLPLSGGDIRTNVEIEGRPILKGTAPEEEFGVVSPGYFKTMGIPLLEGREFASTDTATSTLVVIVNQAFATRYFPNETAVGKRFKAIDPGRSDPPMREIIGIVGNVKRGALNEASEPDLFLPYQQEFVGDLTLVLRTQGPPASVLGKAREVVHSMDASVPLYDVKTMDQYVGESVARPRFNMILLVIFAALALALTTVGIYGVMAYTVNQRTHEIGIRMALGAQLTEVMRLVLGNGIKLALAGIVVGIAVALSLTRLLATLLFGISTYDPLTFAAVAIALMLVALAACYIPARRAMRVDPMVALRYE
jgi:predicted permease